MEAFLIHSRGVPLQVVEYVSAVWNFPKVTHTDCILQEAHNSYNATSKYSSGS